MGDLVSKVLAGGLSAGVFLLWWPSVVPAQGNELLFARGLLWTLAFEVLLLAFRPLERTVGRAVREREPRTVAPRRLAPLLAVAAVAAGGPLALLAGTGAPVAAPARAAAPRVVVKREIVRREVVVRRVSKVVRVAVAAPARPGPAAAAASARKPVVVRARASAPAPSSAGPTERRPAAVTATTPTATGPATSPAAPATSPSTAPEGAPTGAAQPTTTGAAPQS